MYVERMRRIHTSDAISLEVRRGRVRSRPCCNRLRATIARIAGWADATNQRPLGGGFREEFYLKRGRHKARGGSARQKLANGAASFLAVIERPIVDVHANELVGELRVHIAGKLHGVIERGLAMFEGVANAIADHARHLAAQFGAK